VKPSLLIIELWGLGDLVIATPFLRAASEKFSVSLIAKPYAQDLQTRLWPGVEIIPFIAPWTAFQGKYRLWKWPLPEMLRLRKQVAAQRFDVGLSARWDPRDHFMLRAMRVRKRLGFPRTQSQIFLTDTLTKPAPREHRYEYWRTIGRALGLKMPDQQSIIMPRQKSGGAVLIHTGAGQPIRVWPLDRYRRLADWLREKKYQVIIACDPDQRAWWLNAGEPAVATPRTVNELLGLVDQAGAFIGNDSGPGHLAAFCGVPTFSLFGPQLPEWFSPLHPDSICFEGKPCPYKPCSDYCRFPAPRCLWNISEEEAWAAIQIFIGQHLTRHPASTTPLITS
jgi:ADP-heptose:LPS heptosyltransferase